MTNAEIAAVYLAFARDQSEADRWVFGHVWDMKYEGRWDDLWEVILAMSRDPVEMEAGPLSIIAAGPLEDLICEAGPTFIDRVMHEAKFNRRFGRLLTGVWLQGAEPIVRERIVTFCRAFPDPIDGVYCA